MLAGYIEKAALLKKISERLPSGGTLRTTFDSEWNVAAKFGDVRFYPQYQPPFLPLKSISGY